MFNGFFSKPAVIYSSTLSLSSYRKVSLTMLFGLYAMLFSGLGLATEQDPVSETDLANIITQAENLRNQGNLQAAQREFDTASQVAANNPDLPAQLLAALEIGSGYNQLLLDKKEQAAQQLKSAYTKTQTDMPYLHALVCEYLSNLYLIDNDINQAKQYLDEALKSANQTDNIALSLSLQIQSLQFSSDSIDVIAEKLNAIANKLSEISDINLKTKLQLQLSQSLLDLDLSEAKPTAKAAILQLATELLTSALNQSQTVGQERFKAEILSLLARINSLTAHYAESLAELDQAIILANQCNAKELLAKLNAQQGDVFRLQADNSHALAAYTRAVHYLTAISNDIPLNQNDGLSSIDAMEEPIMRNYVDLLLLENETKNPENLQAVLIQAIDSMEIIKQADLQGFFLAKCDFKENKLQHWNNKQLQDAAILYPILLPDRIELIVKTDSLIALHTVKVPLETVKKELDILETKLHNGKDYRAASKQLYEWLVKPLLPDLKAANIKTILYVPDRAMRPIPYAALFNGKQFVVEDFGIVTLSNLNFKEQDKNIKRSVESAQLFAGISDFDGPAVQKLPSEFSQQVLSEARRKFPELAADTSEATLISKKLRLPGVEKEKQEVADKTNSQVLLNQEFTANSFETDLETGKYDKVHIASHGYFGNNAKDSFILAYDQPLSIDNLSISLGTDQLKQNPIDILTLSACDTAKGNDRMLLGFSGMAIKSNVYSALGSLWSTSDKGALEFMKLFYSGLNQSMRKVDALKAAQLNMLKSTEFNHPSFWAPFILTGNWQ